jgi:hypothetical protein
MQLINTEAFMLFLMAAALVPMVFALWRVQVSDAIDLEDQGDFVPQFATSPVALEMHPDQESEEEQTSDSPDAPLPPPTGV